METEPVESTVAATDQDQPREIKSSDANEKGKNSKDADIDEKPSSPMQQDDTDGDNEGTEATFEPPDEDFEDGHDDKI
jgi:hypothetical protein